MTDDLSSLRTAIAKAAPYIDENVEPNKWRPSELIMIGWSMAASSHRDNIAADEWANNILDEARNRYAAGFYANPFTEAVIARPSSNHRSK